MGKKQVVKWTAEGAVNSKACLAQYSATRMASVIAKDMSVSEKCIEFSMNARWHRG